MKQKLIIAAAALCATLPVPAWAVSPEVRIEHGVGSLLWPAINFAIYFGLMVHFYNRYGRAALRARKIDFEQRFAKAAQLIDEADRELGALENRLRNAAAEQQSIRERLATEGAQIAAQVIAAAEQSAEAVKRDVARRIVRELSAANADVRQKVIAAATEVARGRLEAGLSQEDDYRLRQEAVRGLL
jgi:F0F1-type ATP synthase membrane subunit b/b'